MAIDLDRLAPDVRDYINAQVSEGVYSNAEEVLEDAVRRLRQADEERHERLLKALEKGRQGEGIPLFPRADGPNCRGRPEGHVE
jgi:putative addiction module CopG family antidote